MHATKGYYSLVQYCPDRSRLEAVNVGVLLFCPEVPFVAARTAQSNQRLARMFGRESFSKVGINAAKRALERRLDIDRDSFRSLADLQRFVDSRGNVLRLTQPRPVKVLNPTEDLDRLFEELVGGAALREARRASFPQLDAVFQELQQQGRAELDKEVRVPVAGVDIRVPYAYRNGTLKLVKPHRFSRKPREAVRAAMELAVQGDLIHRHLAGDMASELIIVSLFPTCSADQPIQPRVEQIFGEYNVQTVSESGLAQFLERVRSEAHV